MTASQRRKFLPLVGLLTTMLGACGSLEPRDDADTIVMADRGDAQAQYQLGKAYVSKGDEPKAVYRLCQSAVQGMVKAQLELAQLYQRRDGAVARDKDYLDDKGSAYFWYTAASSQGDGTALEARQRLEDSMTAEQIAEAKQRATRWKQAVCVSP